MLLNLPLTSEILLHLGYFFSLLSYSVRDILLLRWILVLSQGLLLAAVVLPAGDAPVNAYWFILFMLVNMVRIYTLYMERRPVHLSDREQKVYNKVFRMWKPRDFQRLMQVAEWKSAEKEEKLIKDGQAMDKILLITSGKVGVQKGFLLLGELSTGDFIGEMSFLTGNDASADVICLEETKYVEWSQKSLKAFLDRKTHLKPELQAVIGKDLVKKIQRVETHISKKEKDDMEVGKAPTSVP